MSKKSTNTKIESSKIEVAVPAETSKIEVAVPAETVKIESAKAPEQKPSKQPAPQIFVQTVKGTTKVYNQVSNRALSAKITAYSDPQRTQVVATFNTFVEAKRWLDVKNVGTSLEKASETGKPSRGYYWIVNM